MTDFTSDDMRTVVRELARQFGRIADRRSEFLIGKTQTGQTGVVVSIAKHKTGPIQFIQFEFVTRDKIHVGSRLEMDKFSAAPYTYPQELIQGVKSHIEQRRRERYAEGPIDLLRVLNNTPA